MRFEKVTVEWVWIFAGGRTVGQTLSPATVGGESVDVIDVNPPRGTRDFAPDEMRLRNWLFHNFREVASVKKIASFCFFSL